jgi:hypothetical protein
MKEKGVYLDPTLTATQAWSTPEGIMTTRSCKFAAAPCCRSRARR